MVEPADPGAGPLTVVVSRRIKPGREREAEDWLHGVTAEAVRFPGHMGLEIIRPTDSLKPEYVLIFRFDTLDHLMAWERSDVRQQWLARAEAFTIGAAERQVITGLEFWFTPTAESPGVPPRWKMLLLTWAAITPLILLISPVARAVLGFLPSTFIGDILRTMLTTALIVTLMTYAVMPQVTRVFAAWLRPQK